MMAYVLDQNPYFRYSCGVADDDRFGMGFCIRMNEEDWENMIRDMGCWTEKQRQYPVASFSSHQYHFVVPPPGNFHCRFGYGGCVRVDKCDDSDIVLYFQCGSGEDCYGLMGRLLYSFKRVADWFNFQEENWDGARNAQRQGMLFDIGISSEALLGKYAMSVGVSEEVRRFLQSSSNTLHQDVSRLAQKFWRYFFQEKNECFSFEVNKEGILSFRVGFNCACLGADPSKIGELSHALNTHNIDTAPQLFCLLVLLAKICEEADAIVV